MELLLILLLVLVVLGLFGGLGWRRRRYY